MNRCRRTVAAQDRLDDPLPVPRSMILASAHGRDLLGDRTLWAITAVAASAPANLVQRGLLQPSPRRIGRAAGQRATSPPLPQQTPKNRTGTSSGASVHRSDQLCPVGESG